MDSIINNTINLKSLSLCNTESFSRHYLRILFHDFPALRELRIRANDAIDRHPNLKEHINIRHSNLIRATFEYLQKCPEVNLNHANASNLLYINYDHTELVNICNPNYAYTFN